MCRCATANIMIYSTAKDHSAFRYLTIRNLKIFTTVPQLFGAMTRGNRNHSESPSSDSYPLPEAKNSLVLSWLQAKNARRGVWLLLDFVAFILLLCHQRENHCLGTICKGMIKPESYLDSPGVGQCD